MSIFGKLLRRKTQKRKRAGRTVDERAKFRDERFLRQLEKYDPDEYKRIMLQRLGMKPQKAADSITTTLDTLNQLRAAGLVQDPTKAGEGNEWKDMLKSLGAGFGMAFLQSQMQQPHVQVQEVVEAPTRQEYIPPAPTQAALPSIAEAQTQEEKVSILTQLAIRELESRDPQSAADWLAGLPVPAVKGLVRQIVETPDLQLPVLLDNLAQAYPDFIGLVDWLRRNPKKFVEIVHALREKQAAVQPKSRLGF